MPRDTDFYQRGKATVPQYFCTDIFQFVSLCLNLNVIFKLFSSPALALTTFLEKLP